MWTGPSQAQKHLGLIALSFLGLGLLSVLGGVALVLLGLFGGAAALVGGSVVGGVSVPLIALVIGVVVAAGGVPELFTWYGLATRKPWGRWLAIVMCTLSLAVFPLGTAFGAWGLWVLLGSGALAAFGMQRSFVADGAAVAVGWFLMPNDRRADRRYRRRRNARGGCGGFLFLLICLGMMATCGTCAQSCSTGVQRGHSGAPRDNSDGPLREWGSSVGHNVGGFLRERRVLTDPSIQSGPLLPVTDPPIVRPTPRAAWWTFKDESGVTHVVDDETKIPPAFKAGAKPFH